MNADDYTSVAVRKRSLNHDFQFYFQRYCHGIIAKYLLRVLKIFWKRVHLYRCEREANMIFPGVSHLDLDPLRGIK